MANWRDVLNAFEIMYQSIAGRLGGGEIKQCRYLSVGDTPDEEDIIRDTIYIAVEQKFGSQAFAEIDGHRYIDMDYFMDDTRFSQLEKLETQADSYKLKDIARALKFVGAASGIERPNFGTTQFSDGIMGITAGWDDITPINTMYQAIRKKIGDAVVKISGADPMPEQPLDGDLDSFVRHIKRKMGSRHTITVDAQFFSDENNLKALRLLPMMERQLFLSGSYGDTDFCR